MPSRRFRVVVPTAFALLLASAGAVLAADPPMHGMSDSDTAAGSMDARGMAPGSADAQMQEGMRQMDKSMREVPMNGDPDHDFVAMMLPHHQGAVAMAEVELRHGKDPSLRKLARAIVAAQDREIGVMQTWMREHPAAPGSSNGG